MDKGNAANGSFTQQHYTPTHASRDVSFGGEGAQAQGGGGKRLCGIYTRLVVNTHAGAMLLAGTFVR